MKYILILLLFIVTTINLIGQNLVFAFVKDSLSKPNEDVRGHGYGMEFGHSGIEPIYSPFPFALKSTEYQLSQNVLHYRSGQREFHDAMFKFCKGKDTMTVIIRKKDLLNLLPEVFDQAFKIYFSPKSTLYISSQPNSNKLLISPYTWNEQKCWDDTDTLKQVFNEWLATYPETTWKTTITKLNNTELDELNTLCVSTMFKRNWRYVFSEFYYQPLLVNSTLTYRNDTIYEESEYQKRNCVILNKKDSSGDFIILQHNYFYDNKLTRIKAKVDVAPNDPKVHEICSYWDENNLLYRVDKYINKENGSRYVIQYSNNIFKRKRKRVFGKDGKPLKTHKPKMI